eukprot:CAMPEP_0171064496 /NCGR_PEP_ID=MMETSP0766_2-20121228/6323_1 /TAXON_ID=439317 /ORGANISM="Gambierdiscus australes, Strain CAWD 149" /LENGTH=500 /DNA_ID=CAMNT_0011520535 /DNA_START=78 /DNA_END=1577 /DNA_ORIENTATION=+
MARRRPGAAGEEDGNDEELVQLTGREGDENEAKGDEKGTNGKSGKGGKPGKDEDTRDKPGTEPQSDLKGEYANIFLLGVLYTLQGIPMGLAAVLPMLLKERNVSFSDLAMFSLNSYPFSLKLLWAPIVDTAYIASVGRRKTWMVPAQLLIGVVMLVLSMLLDDLLYVEKPQVRKLTGLFFFLYFLCATQDIAVDGWALTMLRKENVSYAATCNSGGQTLGYAVGFTGFMVLEHFQLATLPGFMAFWGFIFVVVTLLVAACKKETPVPPEDEPEGLVTSYKQMLSMVRLRAIRTLVLVLFTWKAAFAVVDGVAPLKFQEYGVSKEHMAYLTSLLLPVYIFLPVIVTRWTSSGQPLDLALRAYPFRVLIVPMAIGLAYCTPPKMTPIPWGFYTLVFLVSLMGAVASQCMFVSQMAFFARISDPAMGGTYMTLLNTLANLGGMWPPTVAMKLVDGLTCKEASCFMVTDGFYVTGAASLLIGAMWCLLGIAPARRLQYVKASEW